MRDFNYSLYITLLKWKKTGQVEIYGNTVALRTFNGKFPSKEEIMRFEFPKLVVSGQVILWKEIPKVQEQFDLFDRKNTTYQKQLGNIDSNDCHYKSSEM